MKPQRKLLLLSSCIAFVLPQCNLLHRKRGHHYEYIPLKEYSYVPADIQPGTEVRLLAFSAGRQNDKDNVNYYQFIILDERSGDTVRLLIPLISTETHGETDKTYTFPWQYDPAKGVTDAVYQKQDSSQNILLQIERLLETEDGKSVDVDRLMNRISSNEWVVVNKSMPEFENKHYKTAIGILHFKEIPW